MYGGFWQQEYSYWKKTFPARRQFSKKETKNPHFFIIQNRPFNYGRMRAYNALYDYERSIFCLKLFYGQLLFFRFNNNSYRTALWMPAYMIMICMRHVCKVVKGYHYDKRAPKISYSLLASSHFLLVSPCFIMALHIMIWGWSQQVPRSYRK